MKIQFLQYIRDSLLPQKTLEERRHVQTIFKTARTTTTALSFASLALAILNAHEGQIFRSALFWVPVAYFSHEGKIISENCLEILDNPMSELRAACAKFHSDEKFWRFISEGAPAIQKIGLMYLNAQANEETPKTTSLFARLWKKEAP